MRWSRFGGRRGRGLAATRWGDLRRSEEPRRRRSRSRSASPPPKRRRREGSTGRRERDRGRAASVEVEEVNLSWCVFPIPPVVTTLTPLCRTKDRAPNSNSFNTPITDSLPSSSPPSSLSPIHQASADRAHLRSLNLATISHLSQPLFDPPTPTFFRTISLCTSFGYLSPADARRALEQPSPFVDDERMQELNEVFLGAQIGEGNWYRWRSLVGGMRGLWSLRRGEVLGRSLVRCSFFVFFLALQEHGIG